MLFSQNELDNIKREMTKLKDNISLKLFTDFKTQEDGSKLRRCMSCEGTYELLKTLEDVSGGKLKIEEYSMEENEEDAKKYDIARIPAILFVDKEGKVVIKYSATPAGAELAPFLKSLQYFSGVSPYYKDQIVSHLKKIPKSKMKMFITKTCPYCPATVPVANLFSIVSKGKVSVEIIDVDANPDIAMKYQVQGVPHTIINDKDHIYGMFTPQELLEKLTKGKRDLGGMYS